jgi:hypothetical protein
LADDVIRRLLRGLSMDNLIKWLAPLRQRLSQETVYLAFLTALGAYFLALFLPWTELPIIVSGQSGISASGWDEQAYLAVLPLSVVQLNGLPGRKPVDLSVVGLCIMLAFVMLLVDNVAHRTVWLTPMLADAGNAAPFALFGSTLAVGFWVGLAAMMCLSLFAVLWTVNSIEEGVSVQKLPGDLPGKRA